jgi:predicted AAA+ superfamily ATPase
MRFAALREDVSDLSRVSSWRGPAAMVELLRERVGKPVNYENLAQALGISGPTARSWIELLESWDLFYLRDKEGREVDFVVTLNRKVQWLIEVKTSDGEIGNSLRYYQSCS